MFCIEINPNDNFYLESAFYITRRPEKFKTRPNPFIPNHHLIQWFIECEREIVLNDQILKLNSGDILFSCAGVPYTAIKPEKTVKAINIVFRTDSMKHKLINLESRPKNSNTAYIPFVYHPNNSLIILKAFDEIVRNNFSSNNIMKLKAQCLLKQLIIDIALDFQHQFVHNNSSIERILEIIENNSDKTFSIDELAKRIGMPRRTFIRKFKECTGKTVNTYQCEHKIAIACSIFRTTPYIKIKEVAYSLGFCDEYYFSNVFKSIIGKSPKNYRDNYL